MGRPKRRRSAKLIMKISAIQLTQKSVNTKRSNIVRPPTKRNVPMKRNKSVKPSTKPNTTRRKSVKPSTKPNTTRNKSVPHPTKPKPPMKRNKNVTLLTLKSASQATTMKRNARKSLTNLANTLMFPSMNKCLKKNATTSKFPNKCLNKNATISMYPNATTCQSKNAVSTLCPTAKRSPMKCAKKYPKSSATIFISTNLARKSTGNAKKKLNLTSTSTKPNTTRFANKLKYPNVLPNTQKHVLMRRSNIVKPLIKRNVLKNTNKSVRPSTKPPMKRNKSAQPLTKPKPPMKRNKSAQLLTLKSASPVTTTKRNASKPLTNLANTLMFPSTNKFLKKNATMSTFPKKCLNKNATMSRFLIAKRCLNNIALRIRFPTVKRSLTKSATKNTRRNAIPLTFKSLSKRRSSPVSGLNTDTIMIPPTANLLNNKSANNFNIKNLMETTCEQKWALILQTGWSLSLTFLLGITAVPYSTSTHVSLFIT